MKPIVCLQYIHRYAVTCSIRGDQCTLPPWSPVYLPYQFGYIVSKITFAWRMVSEQRLPCLHVHALDDVVCLPSCPTVRPDSLQWCDSHVHWVPCVHWTRSCGICILIAPHNAHMHMCVHTYVHTYTHI